MQRGLRPRREPGRYDMGIAVPDEECGLKEQHPRVPYAGCSAGHWQGHFENIGSTVNSSAAFTKVVIVNVAAANLSLAGTCREGSLLHLQRSRATSAGALSAPYSAAVAVASTSARERGEAGPWRCAWVTVILTCGTTGICHPALGLGPSC